MREPENDIPVVEKKTNLIIVTEEMVKREIMQLNVNKSCGPDEIHSRLLIEVTDIISAQLGVLMIKTLKDGNMPQDWKMPLRYTRREREIGPKIIGQSV